MRRVERASPASQSPQTADPFPRLRQVFKPHPVEMSSDTALLRDLKENAVRYLKTTANATGMTNGRPVTAREMRLQGVLSGTDIGWAGRFTLCG